MSRLLLAFLLAVTTAAHADAPYFGFFSVGEGLKNISNLGCSGLVSQMKESGVSLLGPYYPSKNDAAKKACQEAASMEGLAIIYYFPLRARSGRVLTADDISSLSFDLDILDKTIDEEFGRIMKSPKLISSVAWWGVLPEELRYWRSNEMRYLSRLIGSIRDAERRYQIPPKPIMMYEPAHRGMLGLIATGALIDVQAMGVYTDGLSDPKRVAVIGEGVAKLVAASKVTGALPIAVLDIDQPIPHGLPANEIYKLIRHSVLLSLMTGAKGVLVWSWYARPGLPVKDRDILVDAFSTTFSEIKNGVLSDLFNEGVDSEVECPKEVLFLVNCFELNGKRFMLFLNYGSLNATLPSYVNGFTFVSLSTSRKEAPRSNLDAYDAALFIMN